MKKLLGKSPINYFSDLFIVLMVIGWILTVIVMIAAGIYSTVAFQDTSIWPEVQSLVAVPLSCGGAIWMIKNSVQHAIANQKGERAHEDFPEVTDDIDINGKEKPLDLDEGETVG